MDRNLKTGLYMFGGLALAVGLFFAVRAMVGDKKNGTDDDDLSKKEREELDRLRRKEEDGTITPEEKEQLDDLEEEHTPGPDDTILGSDDCAAIIGNGTGGREGCKQVAQIQTAINQKHDNNEAPYKYGYCCTDSMIGSSTCDTKLAVDGVMGPCTSKAVKKYYDMCCSCDSIWYTLWINQVCNCSKCSINSGMFGTITAGADISDKKLCAEGYIKSCPKTIGFSGYSNVAGGIDKYEHDFGRTRMNDGEYPDIVSARTGNPFENINIKRTGQRTGGCTSDSQCAGGQRCVNGSCQTTTRARYLGGNPIVPPYARASGGIDKYEHDFGRTTGQTRMSDIQPLMGGGIGSRQIGGGSGCTTDAQCDYGQRCVNNVCQTTTRGRYLGGNPIVPPYARATGPTRYLPPLMDRSSKDKDPTIFDPNDPDGQHRNFTLSNKEQLRGETFSDNGMNWRDQQGPLGDFYPGLFDFTNDNPQESNLTHSYGMGKGFGFDGTTEGDYIGVKGYDFTDTPGETGSETEIQTWDEFVNDVP